MVYSSMVIKSKWLIKEEEVRQKPLVFIIFVPDIHYIDCVSLQTLTNRFNSTSSIEWHIIQQPLKIRCVRTVSQEIQLNIGGVHIGDIKDIGSI